MVKVNILIAVMMTCNNRCY